MSPTFELVASGMFGVMAGSLSGFLGMGGGAILPPLLVLTLGFDQHRAQGISLAALLPPVGLPAVLAYRRAGIRMDPALIAALVAGFLVGAFGGAWLAHRVPARQLGWAFAALLCVSALRAVLSRERVPEVDVAPRSRVALLGIPIGLVAGVTSGLLGIGGGIVAVPLLRAVARLGRLEAQATTLAMMLLPIGLPAIYEYADEQGGLPWPLLFVVALGFALGASLGAKLAPRVDARVASIAYAAFLGVMSVMLVARR